jgi:hypothetical protein
MFNSRGTKVYEPPRFMTVNTAISQLLELLEMRGEPGIISELAFSSFHTWDYTCNMAYHIATYRIEHISYNITQILLVFSQRNMLLVFGSSYNAHALNPAFLDH